MVRTGEPTDPLFNTLLISPEINKSVKIVNDKYEYAYSNLDFEVYIEVDAVQTHHARDAWRSAWGVSEDILNTLGIPNN